jgi:hypothetical protein
MLMAQFISVGSNFINLDNVTYIHVASEAIFIHFAVAEDDMNSVQTSQTLVIREKEEYEKLLSWLQTYAAR